MDNNVKIRIIGSIVVVLFAIVVLPPLLSPKDKGLLDNDKKPAVVSITKENANIDKSKNQQGQAKNNSANHATVTNPIPLNPNQANASNAGKSNNNEIINLSSIDAAITPKNNQNNNQNNINDLSDGKNNKDLNNKDISNKSTANTEKTQTDVKLADKNLNNNSAKTSKKNNRPEIVLASTDEISAKKTTKKPAHETTNAQKNKEKTKSASKKENSHDIVLASVSSNKSNSNANAKTELSGTKLKAMSLSNSPTWLRVASLTDKNNAKKLAKDLEQKKLKTKISSIVIENKTYERVLVGPFTDKEELYRAIKTLSDMGYSPLIQQ